MLSQTHSDDQNGDETWQQDELPCSTEQFERLWSYARARDTGDGNEVNRYLEDRITHAMTKVRQLAQASIQLELEGQHSFVAEAVAEGKIVVGLGFLRMLADDCDLFSEYLIANYIHQTETIGPVVHLPILISPRDFPEAALSLFPGHMLPKAPSGMFTYEGVIAAMSNLPIAAANLTPRDFKAAAGWLAKHNLDIAEFRSGFPKIQSDRIVNQKPPLAHHLLVFEHILESTLMLLLAHEAAHIALGHPEGVLPPLSRLREDEIAADSAAVAMLSHTEFDVRAAAQLFAFLSEFDDQQSREDREHPYPIDRLGMLSASVAPGVPIHRDLNAAMTLVRHSVPLAAHDPSIIAKEPCSWSADLQATLLVEIAWPLDRERGQIERGFEFIQEGELALELDVEIRDPVHAAVIFRKGKAIVPFGISDVANGNRLTRLFPTQPVRIIVPISWWGDHRGFSVAITHLRIFRSGDELPPLPASGVTRIGGNAIVPTRSERRPTFICTDKVSDADAVRYFMQLCIADPIGAARAVEGAQAGEGRQLAERLTCVALMMDVPVGGKEVLWLARSLERAEAYEDLVQTLRKSVKVSKLDQRHLALSFARALWRVSDKPSGSRDPILVLQCLDFAWREAMFFGPDTESGNAAFKFIGDIVREASNDVTLAYLEAVQLVGAAESLKESASQVRQCLLAASRKWRRLWEKYGATVMAVQSIGDMYSMLGAEGADAAEQMYEMVIDLDRGFVPAYTELAKIAIGRGDLARASAWLDAADSIGPDHPFASDLRVDIRGAVRYRREQIESVAHDRIDADDLDGALAALTDFDPYLPIDAAVLGLRARLEFALGHLDQARMTVIEYLRRVGGSFEELVLQAEILLELGYAEAAIQTASIALGYAAHFPTDDDEARAGGQVLAYSTQPLINLARDVQTLAFVTLGRTDQEFDPLDTKPSMKPARAHLYQAKALTILGRTSESASKAALALLTNPPLAPRHYEEASSLADM